MIRALAVLALLLTAGQAVAQTHALADVAVCFVPAEQCTGRIVAALDDARSEIRVQAFPLQLAADRRGQVAAHRRGVDVQVVLDRSNQHFRGGVSDSVAAAGIPVFVDWQPAIAHSKVMVVDRHLAIGGSFNYSASADTRNAENLTFIDSPEVARWLLATWQARQAVSELWRLE